MTLIVMQPTSGCNINCRYCYVPNRNDYSVMSLDVVRATARTVAADDQIRAQGRVRFLWHCGEPLVAGIQFYQNALKIIEEETKGSISVEHSIQTNGTLIDDRWCRFFSDKKMKVGLSIDGPQFLHDSSRVNWSGRGTFAHVMRGFAHMKSAGLRVGALCVITNKHLDHPVELFEFFLSNGFSTLGLNVEEIENQNTQSTLLDAEKRLEEHTLEKFRTFARALFAEWRKADNRLKIREFSNYLSVLKKRQSNKNYQKRPDEIAELGILTVQRNGDVSTFSPEFAGASSEQYSNFIIGNVQEHSLSDMLTSSCYTKLRDAVRLHVTACQKSCYLFDVCGGSHLSNAYFETGTFDQAESTACRLLKKELTEMFFAELADHDGVPRANAINPAV